jgi:hypothetical protein
LLAFSGVSSFPADAALGLSLRIIGEINTAVNRIFGQYRLENRYILTNQDPETIHFFGIDFSARWMGFGRDRVAQPGVPAARTFRVAGVEAPPAVLVEERPFMAARRIVFYRALALVPSFSGDFPRTLTA